MKIHIDIVGLKDHSIVVVVTFIVFVVVLGYFFGTCFGLEVHWVVVVGMQVVVVFEEVDFLLCCVNAWFYVLFLMWNVSMQLLLWMDVGLLIC